MKRPELDDVTDVEVKEMRYHCGGVLDSDAPLPLFGESCPTWSVRRDTMNPPKTDAAALVVTPHPYTLAGQQSYSPQQAALQPGETLASLLARHGVLAGEQWVVSLGGVQVPPEQWARVRPKHGHLVEARRVPQDNDTFRLAAFVALMMFAPQGMVAWQAALYYAGGSFIINKLLPPKTPDMPALQSPASFTSYSLSGGRNRARPFEPMSLVLGEPYCVPDLAAQPYTYFENGEQHLWQLFHLGLNCASVGSLRIGQTALSSYQNVKLGYEGFASGNTGLPLLSNVDTIGGALLDAPTSPGVWTTRTSSAGAVQLAVDLEANLYSVNPSTGGYVEAVCEVDIEYRLVGAPAWEVFWTSEPYDVWVPPRGEWVDGTWNAEAEPGYTTTVTPTNVRLVSTSSKPLRKTISRTVAPGQYEVRARKVTANTTSTSSSNTVTWSTLKTYQVDNASYSGQARLGLQIQASGQLNGALDEFNCVPVAKPMPYWDGAAWVTASNRATGLCNPGAQILLLARGIYDGNGRLLAGLGWADSQIDIDSLKGFMVWCASKSFYFDLHQQQVQSIGELLDAIAYAGLGAISWHTGKLGVIWFADDQPIESVLNMGTIKAKSVSVDYDTQTTADELEFQYVDRARGNTWKSLRVTAPGVVNPQNVGRVPMLGITTEAHAAILARFAMAQNIYQRKTVGAAVDLEHLTFRRGTVMALSHDLTQWGYGGRVQAAVNNAGTVTLTLDDVVPAVGPSGQTARYVGLRIPGENQYRIFPVQAFTGSSRTLTLASAWPVGVAVPGDSAANPAWDTIWIYDFKATPGQKLRVASVEPQGNMGGARVAFVPESAEFWTYVWTGAYTPPPNNSLLQGPPVCTGAVVSEELARQGNTYYTELTATISVTGSYDHAELWGSVAGMPRRLLATTRSQALHWRGGLDEEWWLEVRPFSSIAQGTSRELRYRVAGLRVPPSNVGAITYTLEEVGIRLKWDEIADPDRAGYEIREGGTSWETATLVAVVPTAQYVWKIQASGTKTIRIKALDTSKNYSVTASTVPVVITGPAAPVVSYQLAGSDEMIMWTAPASGFAVDYYEVAYGTDWASAILVTTTKATFLRRRVDYGGARRYLVRAVDLAKNPGAVGQQDVSITSPGSVLNLRAEPLDNYSMLRWSLPSSGSLPIGRCIFRKGATWDAGTDERDLGVVTGHMHFESVGGTYMYWLKLEDTAGNEGTPVGVPVFINPPPDYVLRANIDVDLATLTLSNMLLAPNGSIVGPMNPARTWAQHYSGQGWASPAAKIAAGYPMYAAPNVASGTITWDYDYGTVLPATTITATLNKAAISGTVAVSCQIRYKAAIGDAWTNAPAGAEQVVVSNFRYVQEVWTFTAAVGSNLVRVLGLNNLLAMKKRIDGGEFVSAIGGVPITFGYPFVYADTPSIKPRGLDSYGKPYQGAPVYTGGPNPTGFTARVFDSTLTEVAGVSCGWDTQGY